VTHVLDLLAYAKIKPVCNQIEVHPYFSRSFLTALCQKHNIAVVAYSPLGSGKEGPLQDSVVGAIAQAHNRSAAQILLRWGVQHGFSVIPKSVRKERIEQNANILDFELTKEQMTALDGLNRNLRTCDTREYWNGFDVSA